MTRRFIKRLMLAALSSFLFLLVVELGLRLEGYGQPTAFFVPSSTPGILQTNDRFAWRFLSPALSRAPVPLRMAAVKPAGTTRIFLLGSSAARGYPDPAYGVGRFLEVMLNNNAVSGQVEVINTAITAMNSHVVRAIAEECAKYQPDCFLVYCGNNEVIGPFGPGTVFMSFQSNLRMIRLQVWFSTTRTSQAVRALGERFRKPVASGWGGMRMFGGNFVAQDDSRLPGVYEHYRANIEAICESARNAGARTFLCTVPVNLRDCPPFASTNRPGRKSAQQLFDEACQLSATGRVAEAMIKWQAACDADELHFRADSRINTAIQDVALRNRENVTLVDLAARLNGGDAFYEHVHLNLTGSWRAAAEIYSVMTGRRDALSFDRCCAALAVTGFDQCRVLEQVAQLHETLPFTIQTGNKLKREAIQRELSLVKASLTRDVLVAACATYDAALRARPYDDWLVVNLADLLDAAGDRAGSLGAWQRAAVMRPQDQVTRIKLALAYGKAGNRNEAIRMMNEELARAPALPTIKKALGDLCLQVGDQASAEVCYREAIRLYPDFVPALVNLAALRRQAGADGEREAWDLLTRALAVQDDKNAHADMATLMMRRGDMAGALPHLESAIASLSGDAGLPGDAGLRNNYGTALMALGRFDEAVVQLEAALRINPAHEKARRSLEFCRQRQGALKSSP